MSGSEQPILFAYDGSEAAGHAIDEAGRALRPGPAVVLTVWQRVAYAVSGYGVAITAPLDTGELDSKLEEGCKRTAAEGVDRAKAAGFEAEGAAIEADGPVWDTLLQCADAHDAAMVVLGSRGRSGLKSIFLGSVSHGVASHAHRPVLIVPPPAEE